jgi:hypothetical protein
MGNPDELKMHEGERLWWERVRARGALWYLANKGLIFLVLYPLLGCYAIGWDWHPTLLVEAWLIGIVSGGFVWMRKELRYRFTLDLEGDIAPGTSDE